MDKKIVRKIFIAVLIFLPLQYILVGIVGYYKAEPWPAFVFPGFKNVYEIDKTYQIHRTRFDLYDESNQKIASLSPNHLFAGIPRSQIDGLTRTLFQKETVVASLSPEAGTFLHEKSEEITNSEINKLEVIFRKDFLRTETDRVEIDSVDADTIGIIEVADK